MECANLQGLLYRLILLSIILQLLGHLLLYKKNPFSLFEIIQMNSAFYMFSSPLEFSIKPKPFDYYSGIKNGSENLLCNYTSSKDGCNSTPRDVVITCAAYDTCNLVLFQRTLRTTGCKATLILFMDQIAIDNMDPDTLEFTKQMNTYIFLTPTPPGKGVRTKNYFAYIFKEFLRENEFKIDRVIFSDLFDTLFQEDPFNTRLPTKSLHIVHENIRNKLNKVNYMFMRKTISGFKFDNVTGEMKTINSGYAGGPVSLVKAYFTQQLSILTFTNGDDQGSTNILYVTGTFVNKGIPIAEDDYNGKIRHLVFYKSNLPFPKVNGHINKSVRAAVIHLYYYLPTQSLVSLLRVCPRITKNMKNYIPKKRLQNINYYEMILANEGYKI